MKPASFYLLSIILHGAVLAYPVTFNGHNQAEPIPVKVLPVESATLDGVARGSGASGKKSESNPHLRTPPAAPSRLDKKPNDSAERRIVSAPESETLEESGISFISAKTTLSESNVTISLSTKENPKNLGGGSGPDGGSSGADGHGLGTTSGSGNGTASRSGTVSLIQVRYRDTPRPEYPDHARRQGHEGRVLLRVLVDDQGTAKFVEISRSSGSSLLDQAATAAIKRWRFHPAHSGDHPIESWVNVPVDFRLTEANN